MHRRTITAAGLSAVLALSGTATIAAAQEETQPVEDAATSSVTGMLQTVVGEDGRSTWYLDVDGELIELQFGPSWFSDLAALFAVADGDEVAIGGNLRDGRPDQNASDVAKENAAQAPRLRIKTIGGEERPKGKPAWAGGPKVVGEAHPGHAGWSKGQARKAENQLDATGAADNPATVATAGKAKTRKPEHAKGD